MAQASVTKMDLVQAHPWYSLNPIHINRVAESADILEVSVRSRAGKSDLTTTAGKRTRTSGLGGVGKLRKAS